MERAGAEYEVALHVVEPKFETERRFVVSELAYVKRRLGELSHGWRPLKVPALGVFRREDWQDYAHKLEHYSRELDKHEQEVEEEWLPFQVFVMNTGRHDDMAVKVKVMVDHGSISGTKEAPKRPDRLDGGVRTEKFKLPHYDGFVRSGVQIGHHDLEAEFSRLEAGKSAELVRQTLYLHYNAHTKLRFEIHSKLTDELRGDVVV